MAEVVTKVKVGKHAPKELAEFDEIGLVEEPELVLVGWKAGKRKRLGRAAAAQAMRIVGRPSARTTRKSSTSSSGGRGSTSGGGGLSNAELKRFTGQLESVQLQNERLLSDNQAISSRYDELENRIGDLVTRLGEATQYGARMNQANQTLSSNNRDLEQRNSDLEARNRTLEGRVNQLEDEDLDIIYERNDSNSSDSRLWVGLGRSFGWVGSKMPWRPERSPEYGTATVEERNGRRVVVIEEEYVDGYRADDERRGAAVVLGTLAAVGIGILAAGLWGEHEENEGRHAHATEVVQANQDFNTYVQMDNARDAAQAQRDQEDIARDAADIIRDREAAIKACRFR